MFTEEIELSNAGDEEMALRGIANPDDVRREVVRAIVDSGATMLVIPEVLARRLGLTTRDRKLIGIADGSVIDCDVVGLVKVRFGDRFSIGMAIAVPGQAQILLGAVQMEEMDLLIDPRSQRLVPNPQSPERAMAFAVGARVFGPPAE